MIFVIGTGAIFFAEDEEFNKVIWNSVRRYDVPYPKIRKK
jgi:hypothetical protein